LRPFFFPSWELETENKDKTADLRKTIQKNNIDGVKSVFDAMIDVHQKQKQDDSTNVSSSYVDKVKNLDKYCDDDKMSQASNKLKEKVIEPSILEWLVEMGRQIAEIALNYGEALKQKDQFQMGFAALSGVHDRYIQVKEHFFRQNETRSMCAFIPYPSLYPFL